VAGRLTSAEEERSAILESIARQEESAQKLQTEILEARLALQGVLQAKEQALREQERLADPGGTRLVKWKSCSSP